MRSTASLLLAFAAANVTTTCLSAQQPEQVSGEVTCPDCIITLDTVVTIGGLGGPGLDIVDGFSRVAVDRRGRILVYRQAQPEISVLAPTGGFLRTVGRRGEGPGGYEGISHIGVGPRYIHVFQHHAGRTLLDHDFNFIRTDRFPGQIHAAVVMSGDEAVFAADVPTAASVGHKLHILRTSGEIASHGYDGEVYSSQLNTWASAWSNLAGKDDTVWAVPREVNRLVRWDLAPEPRVGRVIERRIAEFDEGIPSGRVYPRSMNTSAMLDERGLWIVWHTPDPEWTEIIRPGGDTPKAAPREIIDGWLDLVDPSTGRTLARHHQDGSYVGFAEGSRYLVAYEETDAGVPFLHILEPRLSRN